MVLDTCKYCGGHKLYLHHKGQHLGLYCSDCGKWLMWVGKKDIRAYEVMGLPVLEVQPVIENKKADTNTEAENKQNKPFLQSIGITGLYEEKSSSQAKIEPHIPIPSTPTNQDSIEFSNQNKNTIVGNEIIGNVPPPDSVNSQGDFTFKPIFNTIGNKRENKSRGCPKCSAKAMLIKTKLGNLYMVDGVLAIESNSMADGDEQVEVLKYCPYCGRSFDDIW